MKEKYLNQLKKTKEVLNSLPWEDTNFYAEHLAQTYYFVCHSTRLLARSISHFGVDRDLLYRRFIEHLKEENYHEKIALKDLENLGFQINDFPELAETKIFWNDQYRYIDESKGTDILGYILFLEAIAVHCSESPYEKVAKAFGKSSCKFLYVHLNEDPEHLDQAIEQIDSLNEFEKQRVWNNFFETAQRYHDILFRIQERSIRKLRASS